MGKPKLFPVKVPWQVALSVPSLSFETRDFGAPTAEFRATFIKSTFDKYEKIVRVQFGGLRFIQIRFAMIEGRSIDENRYDWSEVSSVDIRLLNGVERDQYFKSFDHSWIESSFCPDPGFYIVNRLDGAKSNTYLLLGEDISVRVRAETFTWSLV